LVSTIVRDRTGKVVVTLDNNKWKVSSDKSICWDKNYNDRSLEVQDGRGHVVLQITIQPDHIDLQGEWHDDSGTEIAVMPYGLIFLGNDAEANRLLRDIQIPPMFK
jgi:hypothetical protein